MKIQKTQMFLFGIPDLVKSLIAKKKPERPSRCIVITGVFLFCSGLV